MWKHKLIFVETPDANETSIALENYRRVRKGLWHGYDTFKYHLTGLRQWSWRCAFVCCSRQSVRGNWFRPQLRTGCDYVWVCLDLGFSFFIWTGGSQGSVPIYWKPNFESSPRIPPWRLSNKRIWIPWVWCYAKCCTMCGTCTER